MCLCWTFGGRSSSRGEERKTQKEEIFVQGQKVELTLNGAVVHDLLHDLLLLGETEGKEWGVGVGGSEIDIKVITRQLAADDGKQPCRLKVG